MKRAEEHLTAATEARSYMRGQVEAAKRDLRAMLRDPSLPTIESCPDPCTRKLTLHYSFDFAQQVGSCT